MTASFFLIILVARQRTEKEQIIFEDEEVAYLKNEKVLRKYQREGYKKSLEILLLAIYSPPLLGKSVKASLISKCCEGAIPRIRARY